MLKKQVKKKEDKKGDGLQSTNIEGFPVAKISEQVIAPAREMMRSAAAYANSIECKNLHNFRDTSDLRKLRISTLVSTVLYKNLSFFD